MTCAKVKSKRLYSNNFREVVMLKNIIPNSSFETNDSWAGIVYDTTQHYQGVRSSKLSGTTVTQTSPIIKPIVGHKYYGRSYIKTQGNVQPADCRFEWFAGDGVGLNFVFAWNRGNFPNWTMQSSIVNVTVVNGTSYIIRNFVVNAASPCWTDCLMIVDLTEAFGAGNEPNQAWCDANIPYFDGTYELNLSDANINNDGIKAQNLIEEANSHVGIVGGSDIKADTFCECITMKNLCQDGSFEQNLWSVPTQYGSGYDTTIYKYGTRSLKIVATSGMAEMTVSSIFGVPLNSTHLYYIRLEAYQDKAVGGVGFYWPIAEPSFGSVPAKTAGQWNLYSYRGNRASFANSSYQCRIDFDNGFTDGILYVDGVVILDLTETFGAGLEPSQAWLDEHVPYFESIYEMGFDGNSWLF